MAFFSISLTLLYSQQISSSMGMHSTFSTSGGRNELMSERFRNTALSRRKSVKIRREIPGRHFGEPSCRPLLMPL